MLSAVAFRPTLTGLLPHAALFYGSPSTYSFYDEEGLTHEVQQGERGEQGHPLMPLVEASRTRLDPSKIFRAFFDAIYVKGLPNTQPASSLCGKHSRDITRAWNGAGEEPQYSLMSVPRRTGTGPSHSPSDRRSKTGSCGCPICSARGYGCCCSALGRRPTPQTSLPRHSAGAAWQLCWRAAMATCRCQTPITATPNSH